MTLLEVLAALPLFAAAGVIIMMLFPLLVIDVPKIQKAMQQQSGLRSMLLQLQQDVDGAVSLPKSAAGKTFGEELLLLERPEGLLCYQISEAKIFRKEFLDDGAFRESQIWSLPGTKIRFGRWERSGKGYAVEVRTAVQYTRQNQIEEKLSNAFVFYRNAMPAQRDLP